ncbi:aspartate-semialdehyde dehydrogenase [Paludibacterium yongneupense]|uniref:aspartate-semialdehyde dehydrogenase n=1 Tax=Paludibacterium yongneupense TaxID=400061 RepID=UPI00040AC469|nr:aspartate-semialdehyde dehydrogenase [Paludibacterium yongneupense]
MSQTIQIAVVGATGLVGRSILELLAERQFPASRVFAVDVGDVDGETVSCGNLELEVHALDSFAFDNVALALFAAGSDAARRYVPDARAAGASVIDFSSAFREDDGVPLAVSGIDDAARAVLDDASLLATPNCTVTPLALALNALSPNAPQRVTVSTYQSVSGSGQAAMEELANQTTALFAQRELEREVYAKRIAFNVLPRIGALDADGVSEEEASVRAELRRVLGLPALRVEATCVRVPVFFGHGWSVNVELDAALDPVRARQLFAAGGLHVVDLPERDDGYATPMEVAGNDSVWVSRVRVDGNVVSFWLTADNVRVGAALNCVKLAETLLRQGRLSTN